MNKSKFTLSSFPVFAERFMFVGFSVRFYEFPLRFRCLPFYGFTDFACAVDFVDGGAESLSHLYY